MEESTEHEPAPGRGRHDPLQRLNEHHATQLLDVARAFGGHRSALSARATAIDDDCIELLVETAEGSTTAHIKFTVAASGPRRRLAFQDLAKRAAELLKTTPLEGTTL